MKEENDKEENKEEHLIYSPRRRKNNQKKKKTINLLEGLGRKQTSDKNALKFVDNELKMKRSKTLTSSEETQYFFNSNYYLIIKLCIIIFILIEEELKSLFTNKSADLPFSIIIIIFMLFYIFELIMFSILLKDYFLKFYFWIDIISIISTLLDIHWFCNSIIESVGGSKINIIGDLGKRNESKVLIAIKIFRIIKIIRVVRINKLFLTLEQIILKIKRKKEQEERKKIEEEEKIKKEEEEESKKKAHLFMEEYIKKELSKKIIPKKNSARFFANIMKNAVRKCKEKKMTISSPKKVINIIAKNLGLSLNNINQNKKKENNDENKSNKSDESREVSLVENNQMIEINLGDNNNKKEETINKSFMRKVSVETVKINKKTSFNFLKKTFLNSENGENRSLNTNTQINMNINNNKEEKKLSEILLNKSKQKVILLILIELFFFTILNPSNFIFRKNSLEIGLKFFSVFNSNNEKDFPFYYNLYINKHKDIKIPLIFLKLGDLEYGNFEDIKKLREQEKISYNEKCPNFIIDNNNNNTKINNCIAVFNNKYVNRLNALLSLIKTILACVVLYFVDFWFSTDLIKMVLAPTDAMVERVKLISENPLQVIHDEEKKQIEKVIEEEKEKTKEKDNKVTCFCNSLNNSQSEDKEKHLLETEILENTISKIGALLALSLGDAGAEIISQNIKENLSGYVNPMIPGKKVCAIYGFCDVRNFTGLTEILQEKVMLFVNDIADIVHQNAFQYGGSANKNIGDAFLLVWKFDNKFTYISKKNNELKVYNCEQVNQICDMALISIIKMFADIEKSKEIRKFRNIEEIVEKFGKNPIKIGFGINLGWSIEGAIGSNFKLDASYLSPNYNMANTCEERTKIYGVDLVMTDKFVENLSNEAQKNTRILDICYDEDEPIGFYTVDFDTSELLNEEEELDLDIEVNVETNKKENKSNMKKIKRFKRRIERRKNIEMATSIPPKKYFWNDFEQGDKDWERMRMDFSDDFFKYYNKGFDEFHFGDWSIARKLLEKVLKIKDDDKPTKRMLEIMAKYKYKKPENFRNKF